MQKTQLRITPWIILSNSGIALLLSGIIPLILVLVFPQAPNILSLLSLLPITFVTWEVLWDAVRLRRNLKTLDGHYLSLGPAFSNQLTDIKLHLWWGGETDLKPSRIQPSCYQTNPAHSETQPLVVWKNPVQYANLSNKKKSQELRFSFFSPARPLLVFDELWGRTPLHSGLGFLQWHLKLSNQLQLQVWPSAKGGQGKTPLHRPNQEPLPFSILPGGGEGREFDSFRKYSPGDDLRRVDWKQSSRGRGLLVRQYRPETHQRVLIALDCGLCMGQVSGYRYQLDHAIDACAFLGEKAVQANDDFGLLAFDESIRSHVPLGKGESHRRHFLQSLATLYPSQMESDYSIIERWIMGQRRRSLLVILTSLSSFIDLNETTRYLLASKANSKHLILLVSLIDPLLEEFHFQPADSPSTALGIGSALSYREHLEQKGRSLKKLGLSLVFCTVDKLAGTLSNHYNQSKITGRL